MHKHLLKDIIKPRKVESEGLTARYGKFVAAPLERGFGTTVGNSLRRILLSSLPGAAITDLRIEGVKHEFSTIPGCTEDVTEIILNMKEVILDLAEKETATLTLDVKGPAEVTAGMITGEGFSKILNPDLHIASLNEEGSLKIEMEARVGRGYVSSEFLKREEAPVGTIFIDAFYSPVRKVNYVVTNARVGQQTDYDKLTLEVWTDSSITPEDAVRGAAIILRDQLNVFAGEQEVVVQEVREEIKEEGPKLNENLFRRIDELELSVRSSNCLENANIKYIGELVSRSENEMLRTKNFGRKSLNEIKEILTEMGLTLGMKIDGFPSRVELDRMVDTQTGMSAV
ncbi:MAG TPA: DNA-directed RNA polymerase subunit alpha [Oligoflexia bacterium]|nr:DNA-directed RNA polymerase subunit alpha [Oligoflexia bacterium]HMP49814.1 DNA-directed RNA polymerase subunit alpha [Oligoflexia bacterium]